MDQENPVLENLVVWLLRKFQELFLKLENKLSVEDTFVINHMINHLEKQTVSQMQKVCRAIEVIHRKNTTVRVNLENQVKEVTSIKAIWETKMLVLTLQKSLKKKLLANKKCEILITQWVTQPNQDTVRNQSFHKKVRLWVIWSINKSFKPVCLADQLSEMLMEQETFSKPLMIKDKCMIPTFPTPIKSWIGRWRKFASSI